MKGEAEQALAELRSAIQSDINSNPKDKADLEKAHDKVWDTNEMTAEFEVHDFLAPFVVVTRKSDGKRGSLLFQHHPRLYWGFKEAT